MRLLSVSATCLTIAMCAQTRSKNSTEPRSKSRIIIAPWPALCEFIDAFTGDYKDIESSIRVDTTNWINAIEQLMLKRIEQVEVRRTGNATVREKTAIDIECMEANAVMHKVSKTYNSRMDASGIMLQILQSRARSFVLSAISNHLRLPHLRAPQLQVLISNVNFQWSYFEAVLEHIEAYEQKLETKFLTLHHTLKYLLEALNSISVQLQSDYKYSRAALDYNGYHNVLTNVLALFKQVGPELNNAQIDLLHATFLKHDLMHCAYVISTIVENAIILYAAANE